MDTKLTEQVCEFYGKPGQDCVTAGPEVVAAEGLCGSCAVRYLARPAAPDPRIDSAVASVRSAFNQGPNCYTPGGWHALCGRLLAALDGGDL